MSTPLQTPVMYAPESGSLHVWLTRLAPYCENEGQLHSLTADITDAELNHANTFRRPDARHRYLQVRAEVRQCLARYTGTNPRELNLARGEQGKPFLSDSPFPLAFNLSHSGEYVALAVSAGTDVGIDLEQVSEQRSWQAIAKRYFHAEEFTELMTLPAAERLQSFYRFWTLKEAFFKARGTGIATGLNKAIFNLHDTKINYRFAPELGENIHDWQFQQGQWSPHYHLALASKQPSAHPLHVYFFAGGSVETTNIHPTHTSLTAPLMASSA